MKEKKEKVKMEKKEKVRRKGFKREIAGRIIAGIMALLMLLAAGSSLIYYFIYNV